MGEDGVRGGPPLLVSAMLADQQWDLHPFPWEKQHFDSDHFKADYF